jgi:hypothetical protein
MEWVGEGGGMEVEHWVDVCFPPFFNLPLSLVLERLFFLGGPDQLKHTIPRRLADHRHQAGPRYRAQTRRSFVFPFRDDPVGQRGKVRGESEYPAIITTQCVPSSSMRAFSLTSPPHDRLAP